MGTVVLVVVVLAIIGGILYLVKSAGDTKRRELEDAKSEARRWVERLGGQVMSLNGTDTASQQAMADASERFTAAGSQMEQAQTKEQARQVTQTAMEGLYYVRAARVAMDMDPGPELPDLTGQGRAGSVSEDRDVTVEGHEYAASPKPGSRTPHYYPGGVVAGRPVPQGWYSEPWWKPALVAGAWGVGSFLLFDAMFSGMHGYSGDAMGSAYSDGYQDGIDAGDGGGDGGGYDSGGFDAGSDGFDAGGFDMGGFDF
ncbi:hypothetical protein [Umezawaea sp. Da 62-37]|uniref:hypothetical protein n=1 Tax=Umezawaea sp. Da 62-37 TaxID=3075927 RepID=UPI0028F6C492|nr:hypothetical protein [Umezawaea sp. Da 62-37]WNV83222.1 hypothetical protein RM788_34260 [Umezawaea sp. Da 62-37]